jgi:hypothetical protein
MIGGGKNHFLTFSFMDPDIPEKYKRLMMPDEPSLALEIIKTGNIFYMFSWLNESRRQVIFFPDGELKTVLIPMDEFKFPAFEKFVETARNRFKLVSGGNPFNYELFLENGAKIKYLGAGGKVIAEKPFPCVRIWVWLKHLKEFISLAVEAGFIAKSGCKAIKEQRAVIYETTEENKELTNPGVPELGFEKFIIRI